MDIKIDRYAKDAINEFLQYSCVFLASGSEGDVATEVGSGVVIKTKRGRFVILTAGHIVKELKREEYRLGFYKCPDGISEFAAGYIFNEGDVDVGVVVVRDRYSSLLDKISISEESIPLEPVEITTDDILVLNGFPAKIVRDYENKRVQGFRMLSYWCCPESIRYDKKGRYCLEWQDAVQWHEDSAFDLPSPVGMSGGPLWCFRRPKVNSIWTPRGIGQIIGVQSAWNEKDATYIESVNKWSGWLQDSLQSVDNASEDVLI